MNKRVLAKWQQLLVFALILVLPVSAIMVAVVRTVQVDTGGNDSNVVVTHDFEYLVEKYIDLFVQNDNGTVSLNVDLNTRSAVAIDEDDIDVMRQYESMLNVVNKMVADDMLYVADDGYYVVDDIDARSIGGGKDDFYIRTKKVLFVPVPIGYYFSLKMTNAIIFETVMKAAAGGLSYSVVHDNARLLSALQAFYGTEIINRTLNSSSSQFVWIRDILERITKGDLNAIFSAISSSIFAKAMTIILTFASNWVYDNIAYQFGMQADANAIFTSNNTVWMECNLVLGGRNFGVAIK